MRDREINRSISLEKGSFPEREVLKDRLVFFWERADHVEVLKKELAVSEAEKRGRTRKFLQA